MSESNCKAIAIIVAGGSGSRAKSKVPKQFVELDGKPIYSYSLAAFCNDSRFIQVILILPKASIDVHVEPKWTDRVIIGFGGETRAESVKNGMDIARKCSPNYIFIHDAARPGIGANIIDRLFEALECGNDGALPALPINDALWHHDGKNLIQQLNRTQHLRAQTPQSFDFAKYDKILGAYVDLTTALDDAQIAISGGMKICFVQGEEQLEKITTPNDFERLANIMNLAPNYIPRIGNGFDAHNFCEGNFITICGEKITHSMGLKGHSDADVAWHALVDAILGAIGKGDIGRIFPPTDPQWKGAASSIFLNHARELVEEAGGRIANIDVTIICEAPRMAPFVEQMVENTSNILRIGSESVNIKATTTEKMGFTGRREGIAAIATACILTRT